MHHMSRPPVVRRRTVGRPVRRLIKAATSARLQVWIAGVSLVAWIVLFPVTMLTGLRSAIWFITLASLFANVATCFGWWVSSLVNVKTDRIDEIATLAHIEALEQRILTALEAK